MNKKPIKNIGIFIIVAVASGWLGLLIDKSLEQQTDGDSLGMGVWLILPLLTTIILRLWAYGATVCLTIASGIIMLMASSADTLERQAVEQRQKFDQLTEDIETDAWAQSDLARLYVIGDAANLLI